VSGVRGGKPGVAGSSGSGGFVGVVLRFAGVAGLYDEIPPVTVQRGAVQDVVLAVVEVDRIPVRHEPVLVAAEKEVGVRHGEEPALHALAGTETGAHKLEQFALIVLAAQHVFVRPGISVGNSLPPGRLADQFNDPEIFQFSKRLTAFILETCRSGNGGSACQCLDGCSIESRPKYKSPQLTVKGLPEPVPELGKWKSTTPGVFHCFLQPLRQVCKDGRLPTMRWRCPDFTFAWLRYVDGDAGFRMGIIPERG